MYLYTDTKGKVLKIVEFEKGMGLKALSYRRSLKRKLKKEVVAWCQMGGDNAELK